MTQRNPDETIRAWFNDGPDRGPGRGLEATLARLAHEPVSRRREIRLPVWFPVAAALALLLVGVIAFGAGFRIVIPDARSSPAPSPTAAATSAGACRIDIPVHGKNAVLVGMGFAPDADVVVDFDRVNGTRFTMDATNNAALHTDRTGGFAVGWRPFPEDLGTGTVTARAGCAATIPVEVTAADLPLPCGDPAIDDVAVVDGPAYRTAVAADAPVAWWPFDAAGALGADAVGAHPGTIVGNVIPSVRSPLSDGGSAYFLHQFPDRTHVDVDPVVLEGDFSVEFWLWFCHWADGDGILGDPDSRISIRIGDGEMHVFADTDGVLWAGEDVISGAWQHYVITRRDSTLTMYLNGELDEQYPDTGWTVDFPISRLGGDFDSNFLGFLDEIALYDFELSPERVALHAHPGL
jgi:hypothetical protein